MFVSLEEQQGRMAEKSENVVRQQTLIMGAIIEVDVWNYGSTHPMIK